MRKRWSADELARVLREADRDLTKGLTVGDVCRKLGIAQNTYDCWIELGLKRPVRLRKARKLGPKP
jgi:hypothetical protein